MGLVAEHTKTGIRMGLGVFITCSICFGVIVPILGLLLGEIICSVDVDAAEF